MIYFDREFSENQRGAFADPRAFGGQQFPKRPGHSPSTRRILAIMLPIAGFVVLAGVGVLVFLYYKKFRTEQHRARKLSGAIRLDDTYSSKFTKNNLQDHFFPPF